tara:strand:+ start:276 stop:716 length:441 start_codon:yes stop_codon:yes gene_type:complete
MNNIIKFKTRMTAIQLVAQQLIDYKDINLIKDDFDKYYKNTVIYENEDIVQYNDAFLLKLISFYQKTNFQDLSNEINNIIDFNRKFEKWDTITKSIILVSISELRNSKKEKIKIILNDYLDISKSFVNIKETKLINSILDKLINDK